MIGAVSQVEAGPQDGTLLVTWQPVLRPPASGPVTGYAVYADGKKVTDVDSPTGDHALIDIGKLIGLNPKCVTVSTVPLTLLIQRYLVIYALMNAWLSVTITCCCFLRVRTFTGVLLQVRTKSRDSQSSDSAPTAIPPAVLRGVVSRVPRGPNIGSTQPATQGGFRGQRPQPYQQHQQVIEHDENLSDKEIFPTASRHDPQTTQVIILVYYFNSSY